MLSCTLQLYLHLNTSQITQFAPCKPGDFAILAPKHISNIICRRNLSSRYRHRVSSAAAPLHLQSHHEVIKPNSSTNVIATSPFHISFARPQFPGPRGVFPRLTSQIVRELGGSSPGPWFAVALQACKVALQNRSTAFFACSLTPS